MDILELVDSTGRSPFADWRAEQPDPARARIQIALVRLSQGNTSQVKSLGDSVSELRIDWGPGYRIYFGWAGRTAVLLLAGGTKSRQQNDIARAKALWSRYKEGSGGSRNA
jgi:putative addiction module killer protein